MIQQAQLLHKGRAMLRQYFDKSLKVTEGRWT